MLRTTLMLALAGLAAVWSPAGAQGRWSAEFDAGAAVATGRLAGADLTTGFGLGGTVGFRVQPHLSVYGGWEWHRFGTDGLLGAADLDVENTGYTFGVRFEHPFRSERSAGAGLGYWLRAGGLANHIEIENGDGDNVGDSGHGLGYEVGGGLSIPIGRRAFVAPGVRYRSLRRDVEVGAATRAGTLAYVMLGAGLGVRF